MAMRESDTSGLADDFRDCIDALNDHGVAFVLVGGYAVGWHGVVRATGDIDFLYDRSKPNVERLCAALDDFGAPPELIDPAFMRREGAVTQLGQPPLRIDFLASITGVSFADVFAGSHQVELHGQSLRIIGLRELRKNKVATGRPQDLADLDRLPPDPPSESTSRGKPTARRRR